MRTNRDNTHFSGLDEEEQELLDSFERGEWKSVENLEEESRIAREAAANYLRKDARYREITNHGK